MKFKNNYTLMCDFYELTMANGYFQSGIKDQICYFDVFYRTIPDKGGFSIAAGLEQVIDYVNNLRFDSEDIDYLRSKGIFGEDFLEYLKNFKFSGDIYAVPEGTPIFPNEPIMTIRAKAIEAQLLETYVLAEINHQSLIATKTQRIVKSAQGRPISEFGARRAHGAEAAILGARAAYIAGCASTSNTLTDLTYGVPASGTMAHSWIQMFPTEYDAFKAYCEIYPKGATLLIDTFDVIKSGLPNAIKAFNEILIPKGCRPAGVRIDSGDIAYLSKKCRKILDENGFSDCKIFASNSLDEYLIRDFLLQDAKIDAYGVGERLITSKSDPVFDGVYKLCAVEDKDGNIIPKIKVSENVAKITTPGFKKLYRLYSNETGHAEADLLTLIDEKIEDLQPFELFDQHAIWKRKQFDNVTAVSILKPIFKDGVQVYKCPNIEEIRQYCKEEVEKLWDEVTRFENPHTYYVDLSQKLYDAKHELLLKVRK